MKSSRACLAVVSCLSLLSGGCGKPTAAVARSNANYEQLVEVVPLARRDLVENLTLVGSIAARESAEVRPQASGVVTSIEFEEGSLVKAGQTLLRIDDTEIRAQLLEVEAELELAESNYRRMEELGRQNTIPQADIDAARARLLSARARVELQRSRLDKTTVRAPFTGLAGGREISPEITFPIKPSSPRWRMFRS